MIVPPDLSGVRSVLKFIIKGNSSSKMDVTGTSVILRSFNSLEHPSEGLAYRDYQRMNRKLSLSHLQSYIILTTCSA